MKKLLLAALFLCSMATMNAQDIATIIEKSEFKTKDKGEIFLADVLELPGNEKIAVFKKFRGATTLVHKYDAEGKLVKEVKFEPKYEIKSQLGGHTFIYKNTIYVIYIAFNNNSKLEVHISTAGLDDLVFTDSNLMSFETTNYPLVYSEDDTAASSRNTYLNTKLSNDKSHFIIYYNHPESKEIRTQKLLLVDVVKKNIVFEHSYDKDAANTVFFYDNVIYQDGAIYALANARRVDKLDFNIYLEAQKISSGGIQRVKFEHQDNMMPNRLTMKYHGEKLLVVGFYGQKKNLTSGVCYFDIETASMGLKNKKIYPFTSQFYIDKFGKDKPKDIDGLQNIGEMLILDNGDIAFTGEAVERIFYQTGGFTMNYYDIIIGRISETGDLKWIRNINKIQKNGDGRFGLSYAAKAKDDNVFIFLNAEELRGDAGNPKFKNADYDHSSFYALRFDIKGNMDYKKILDKKDRKVEPNPRYCVKASEGDAFYIFGQDDYNRLFAKVKL